MIFPPLKAPFQFAKHDNLPQAFKYWLDYRQRVDLLTGIASLIAVAGGLLLVFPWNQSSFSYLWMIGCTNGGLIISYAMVRARYNAVVRLIKGQDTAIDYDKYMYQVSKKGLVRLGHVTGLFVLFYIPIGLLGLACVVASFLTRN